MECCLPVIVLADLPYSHQRFEVLIGLVGVDVVEGAAVSGIPIGCCEIYCHLGQKHTHTHSHINVYTHIARVGMDRQWHTAVNIKQNKCDKTYCELNLAASHDVIQERIHFDDLSGEILKFRPHHNRHDRHEKIVFIVQGNNLLPQLAHACFSHKKIYTVHMTKTWSPMHIYICALTHCMLPHILTYPCTHRNSHIYLYIVFSGKFNLVLTKCLKFLLKYVYY